MFLNLWSYKAVRLRYSNPMIQPETEGSTQGYPLISAEVLSDEVLKLKNFKKDALLKHFKLSNQERIYQLANEIVDLKQSNCSIEIYYHKLKGLWDEMDVIEAPYACSCYRVGHLLHKKYLPPSQRIQLNNRLRTVNMVTSETSNIGDPTSSQSTPLELASNSTPNEALVYARMD
ncbi:retrovirus-related pol polyprotein from transposon TNT 1-94 [Tanacetum coccineum]